MHGLLKRYASMMLAVVLVISISQMAFSAYAVAVANGDVNGDGKLGDEDVSLIVKYASGIEKPSPVEALVADFDCDGVVTINDAVALQKALMPNTPENLQPLTHYTPAKKSTSNSTAAFCTVKTIVAETLAAEPIDDESNPLYSQLPKDTVDYVSSSPVTDPDSGRSYYVLKSGRRVYTSEVTYLKSGYVLPDNAANLTPCVNYTGSSTNLYLALDWKVPFNVQVKPQSYESGYGGLTFNIVNDDFTGSYIDIVFYYTPKATGTLTFPESSTIKSSKWIVDGAKKTSTLRLYLRTAGNFYGYNVYYNSKNYLIISIKEPVKALKGRVITIDPGHGGVQPGAGSGTGVYERELTYKIALQLQTLLKKAGATVVMARDASASVPEIEERRTTAIANNPDLFVSIHLDAVESHSVHGSSVFYYKNYSGELAQAIADALPATLKSTLGYNMSNRGAHFYPFCVTRIENCPAVLVECGFITNTTKFSGAYDSGASGCDFELLNSDDGQKAVANGIYNGIMNYFGL